jgi:hypothetical protein
VLLSPLFQTLKKYKNMSCDLTRGFNERTCTNNIGGIDEVILLELSKKTGATVTNNELTAFTFNGQSFRYQLKTRLSSYTAPPIVNRDNGTKRYEQVLTMVFNNDTKELRAEIDLLVQNNTIAFVKKASGVWVVLGLNNGLEGIDGNEYTSGVTAEDRNGHTVVLGQTEFTPVPDVAPAIISALLAAVSPSAPSPSGSPSA